MSPPAGPTGDASHHAEPGSPSYVSRGGFKLAHALEAFEIDATGLRCADLGCSTGGFTDCLLQHGAASVVCVDTAYGELAWKLRSDDRVTVRERTNALHANPDGSVDLVVIDIGWTPQRLALPAAAGWLVEGGRIITLVKPHYELSDAERSIGGDAGVLTPEQAHAVTQRVLAEMAASGFETLGLTASPILGGGKRSKRKGRGNIEYLALLGLLA